VKTIAVLGYGTMGRGLVQNLRSKGFKLRLYNRTPSKIETTDHYVICSTPAMAVSNANYVLSCVSDDNASTDVWFTGKYAATSALKKGTIVIEMSTLSTHYIKKWKEKMKKIGCKPIDAPMTGSKIGAESGNLVLFIGGNKKDINQASAIFKSISKKYYHLGSVGAGTKFKLMFNLINATCLVALSEAFYVSTKLELDLDKVLQIFKENGGWIAKISQVMGDSIVTGLHEHNDVFMRLEHLKKDITYLLREINVPLGSKIKEIFESDSLVKHKEKNMSAVSEFYFKR